MITVETAIELMRSEMLKLSVKKHKYRDRECSCRCPFCGDSKKNYKDEHLYMRLAPDTRDRISYFPFECKLCGERRRVFTLDDVRKFGIESPELIEYISDIKKKVAGKVARSGSNSIAKKLDIGKPNIDVTGKKEYMMKRLGCQDICDNPEKYKIIYDLRSFFQVNKLEPNHDYFNVRELLKKMHDNCVGFISFDNTHINFRDLTGKMERRYTQYMIYPGNTIRNKETSGIYMVPTSIDAMSPELHIVMAEGPFDILRIYSDFYQGKADNTVFASVANANGYNPCISKLLELGFMFDSITVYSDNDVDRDNYVRMLRPLAPDCPMTIYYNTASKDCGDIQEPCKLSKISI